MDGHRYGSYAAGMNPMKPFTPAELRQHAAGARALAHLAEQDAACAENPTIRAGFLDAARTHTELAERCEWMARELHPANVESPPVFRQ